jgi:hypothetical protein
MSLNNPPVGGFNYAPAYDVPAIPWVTSSTVVGIKLHTFQRVTEYVLVKNEGAYDLWLAFTYNGFRTSNCLKLIPSESFTCDVRVKEIYLSSSNTGSYTLFAGLTLLTTNVMPELTASSAAGTWEGVG